jgi:tRNA (adenine37-N6)-methyltransferase
MIEMKPIGVIHTPYNVLQNMPIQPVGAAGVKGTVEIFDEYKEGLADLNGFSHIILLFHFHKSEGFKLKVTPFMDKVERGVFSTRAPKRPNQIGFSVVQLDMVEEGVLYIQNADILDGTPLLDIKPYVPDFTNASEVRLGWLEEVRKTVDKQRSDERFL